MRALRIDGYAPAPSAHLDSTTIAEPGPGEVSVRVEAAALNPLDAKLAQGGMTGWFPLAFPYVPGTDFAGEVLATGEGVTDLEVGEAVFGRTDPVAGGVMAESLVVPARFAARRPPSLDAVTAAGLPTPAGIAHQALFDHLRVSERSRLLILGAGGAVGRAAVQLASRGIDVVACANRSTDPGSAAKVRWIDPHGPALDLAAAESDLVLDCAGGDLQRRTIAALRPGTRLATIVEPADEAAAAARGVEVAFLVLETRRQTLEALAQAVVFGGLRPEAPSTFGLEEAPAIFHDYIAGRRIGKFVMTTGVAR